MTLAIGIAGPGYSVLAADSIGFRHTDFGSEAFLSAEGKIGVLGGAGLAFVHSGTVPEGWRWADERLSTFEDTSRVLFGSLPEPQLHPRVVAGWLQANPREFVASQIGRAKAQDLLLVDVATARLAHLHKLGERWFDADGGVVVTGAARDWARDTQITKQPTPQTLEAATSLALRMGRAFIQHIYQGRTLADFQAAGTTPCVAYPLHVLTITKGDTQRWIYDPQH